MAEKKSKKDSEKDVKAGNYSASSITVLEGLDPVRKRPGMYIGTTGPDGLHHLIWEVFDNSRDEAMGGWASRVEVALLPGNRVRVVDNGRGIPVDMHKQTKVSALETIMTTLHAGGKFGGEGYKVSGGLHGVGVSVVNALSTNTKVEVHRDGGYYMQEYVIGKPKAKVKKISESAQRGTIVTFEADPTIFPEIKFDWNKIVEKLRQQAYLVKAMRLAVIDAREYGGTLDIDGEFYLADLGIEVPSQSFYFEGGLRSLVAFNNQYQTAAHKNIFYVEKNDYDKQVLSVEVALQYVDDISARITAFANNIYTPEGGTHITGFKTALTRSLNTYARKNKLVKDAEENFTGDDALEGLTAVVSIKMPDIQFEGQTKAKLGSVEARGAVESVFSEAFGIFLEENPDDARAIVGKVMLALKARKAAKAAKDSVLRKGMLEGMALPGKLADCQTKSAEESELFIVEGDSAGGCFAGDTKIALTDGRDLSLADMVREHKEGSKHFCYTIDGEGYVGVGEVKHPRITKHDAQVLAVVLDNGEQIVCTPDHKFMLRDGSYREARLLKANDSLMPLYRKTSEMGNLIFDPKDEQWRFLPRLLNIFATEKEDVAQYHNHRVVEVRTEQRRRMDVYDLEVADTHNFALASGVFVHNSAKMGRDRRTQAILPLRGKILNVERARLDRMLGSEQVKNLVIALGTAIGDVFDLSKLRYHKIIIATDADVDGAHIRTLLLTLFYRYFRPIIDGGFIYIAQPPLYKIQRGKEILYAYNDEEKMKILGNDAPPADAIEEADEEPLEMEGAEEEVVATKSSKVRIQRYKGLGEMNPEELWETTMNPANRILKRVRIEDAQEADKVFDILMGTDVASRKSFIQSNARMANLDI